MAKHRKKTKRVVRPRGKTEPIPEEVQAHVWVLREEGASIRQIGKEVDISAGAVQRILTKDPVRLEALSHALREERATLYKTTENKSQHATLKLVGAIDSAIFAEGGKLKPKKSQAERELLEYGAKMLSAMRHTAADSTRMHQLLTGGATERIENTGGEMLAEEMTPDQVIDACMDAGLLLMLPAALREIIERRQAQKQLPARDIIDEA